MPKQLFLVERYLPGADGAALDALRLRLQAAVVAMQRCGGEVSWVQSIVVPGDDTCLCLFRASARALVVEANERATADWERISPVLGAGEL